MTNLSKRVLPLALTLLSATPAWAAADDAEAPPSPLIPEGEAEAMADREGGTISFKVGKGMTLQTLDKAFKLEIRPRVQFLYTFQGDSDVADGEDTELSHGFQIRRARVVFSGHTFNKHNKYKAELAISPRDEAADPSGHPRQTPLLDWYTDFTYLRDLTLRVGQYKIGYNRQRVISSGNLQLVDRSIAQAEFNLDRDVGFDVRSKDLFGLGKLKYAAGVFFGGGRGVFQMSDEIKPLYLARVEFLPFGDFDDYSESDFARATKPGLSIGLNYGYNAGQCKVRAAPAEGTEKCHNIEADFIYKHAGFSAMGEFYYRKGDGVVIPPDPDADAGYQAPATPPGPNGIGWFLQAGYMIPHHPIEIAARYSEIRPLDEDNSTTGEAHEVGGGVSWYMAQHPLKLQADYFHVWDDDIGKAQDTARLQLQVAF